MTHTGRQHRIAPHVVRQLKHSAKALKLMAALMGQGDAAALHDTRVQIRTMTSVLQPFLGLSHTKPLRRRLGQLKAWVSKSNRVRDGEAQLELIAELLPEPYPGDVQLYLDRTEKALQRKRAALAHAKPLAKLPRRMKQTAETANKCLGRFSQAALEKTLKQSCEDLLSALRKDCSAGMQTAKQWHAARLRVKQLRYLIDCYPDFLDTRLHDFAADAKLAQQNLGRLRDWQNLRKAMANEPVMDTWLALHEELEAELERQAGAGMAFLSNRLVQQAPEAP